MKVSLVIFLISTLALVGGASADDPNAKPTLRASAVPQSLIIQQCSLTPEIENEIAAKTEKAQKYNEAYAKMTAEEKIAADKKKAEDDAAEAKLAAEKQKTINTDSKNKINVKIKNWLDDYFSNVHSELRAMGPMGQGLLPEYNQIQARYLKTDFGNKVASIPAGPATKAYFADVRTNSTKEIENAFDAVTCQNQLLNYVEEMNSYISAAASYDPSQLLRPDNYPTATDENSIEYPGYLAEPAAAPSSAPAEKSSAVGTAGASGYLTFLSGASFMSNKGDWATRPTTSNSAFKGGSTPQGLSDKYNGASPENIWRTRNLMAEVFERAVRMFVAGSKQLKQDLGGETFPVEVKGMYQGYFPKIYEMTETCTGGFRQANGEVMTMLGSCTTGGIANEENRWFSKQSSSGESSSLEPYKERVVDGRLYSHRCDGTKITARPEFPKLAGRVVHRMLSLMEKMKDQILDGRIVDATTYKFGKTPADHCALMKEEIKVMRTYIRKSLAKVTQPEKCDSGSNGTADLSIASTETQSGKKVQPRDLIGKSKNVQDALKGGTTEITKANDPTKDMGIPTQKACYLAAVEKQTEFDLFSRYLFCVWKSAADEIMDETIASVGG